MNDTGSIGGLDVAHLLATLRIDPARRGIVAVAGIAVCFAAVLTWLGLWRYAIYRAGVDTGIFTQVVLSLGSCFCATAEGGVNHLRVHWSPIIGVAYPFAKFLGGAPGLIVVQAGAIGATAFPLYFLARLYCGSLMSAALTCLAMLYPVLCAQAFTDFHENAFVPALSAMLALAVAAHRWRLRAIAVIALLLVKEDQFVQLAGVGAIIALMGRRDSKQRTFGAWVFVAAIACGFVYFGFVRQALGAATPYGPLRWYLWNPSLSGMAGFYGITLPARVYYLFWALLPLLFLPLGSRLFLLAIPGLLEVLLSHEHITMAYDTHYSMIWSGYVLAAFTATAARIVAARPVAGGLTSVCVAAACVGVLAFRDPMSRWYYLYRTPDANDALLGRISASIPPASAIGGTDVIYAHLATRPNAMPSLRSDFVADYYIADPALGDPTWDDRDKGLLQAAVRKGTYRILMRRGGVILAQKAIHDAPFRQKHRNAG